MKNAQVAATLVALALVAGTASAQNCAGFTDVSGASGFCPNVEWLKNRAITLGCTSTTLYCPNDPVSRLAMAAFMNRLGNALTPEILKRHAAPGALTIPDAAPFPIACQQQADTAAQAYPRQAVINGTVAGLADANAVAWRGFIVYSIDGGTTWQSIQENASPINSTRGSSAGLQWSGVAVSYALDLEPGTTYRFGIGILRDNLLIGTTGNFTESRCQLTAAIFNRNGTTSPF